MDEKAIENLIWYNYLFSISFSGIVEIFMYRLYVLFYFLTGDEKILENFIIYILHTAPMTIYNIAFQHQIIYIHLDKDTEYR